jgi:hypothetical protein
MVRHMMVVEELRAVEQQAFAQATRSSVADVATFLQDVFGQKLTALLAGIGDPKAVSQWARGERLPHPPAEQRLRRAYQVALLLLHVDSAPTVRAWFTGMNPQLDDRAPVLVLADEPERVLQAARAFVVGA